MSRPPAPDLEFYRTWVLPALRALSLYHRYDLQGVEHVPKTGPALLLLPHPMLTYDGFMMQGRLFERTGRLSCGLADRFWFERLKAGEIMIKCGFHNTTPTVARELVEAGELLGITPGGMREALRPSTQRHQVRWERRTGFARLALVTRAPVVLCVCPGADMALTLYANPITDFIFENWKVPLPLMRGVGPTWIPRPVKLTHYFREPILPPRCRGEVPEEDEVIAFRDELRAAMQAHIDDCCRREGLK